MTSIKKIFLLLLGRPAPTFTQSGEYWEKRYALGGKSGAGSVGRLAKFKAEVLNRFVREHRVRSVMELGCGDGSQLDLADYQDYTGIDIAETALAHCRRRFANDATKRFFKAVPSGELYDLTMSLDVIYHLVEDEVYHAYMDQLFAASRHWVVVYASNLNAQEAIARWPNFATAQHVYHRRFTDWIAQNRREWTLHEQIENKYPYDTGSPNKTSFADFFIFKKRLGTGAESN